MPYPDRSAYPDRFYPVVDSIAWVARLTKLGVGTIQLRAKDLNDADALAIVREAVTTAKLARELFGTSWIKLEVIADNDTLQPDVVGLVEAATILIKDGFEVFPYCTEDLSVATRLVDAGCKVVMPWAAPIGSAKGIINRDALNLLRERLPDITLVVDAGIGAPSHAAEAMELGFDAVLLNTAIAKAADPVAMAGAFRLGVEAGRSAHEAGLMEARDFASPSTPVVGTPFWHAVS